MVPTLAPHTTSKSRDSHVPEDIPRFLPRPNSQDGYACGVCDRGAFAVLAGAAADICFVGALKTATVCAASVATSTAATSTVSCKIFCHRQLDSHGLKFTGSWETGRPTSHVTLPYKISEGGVQARWVVARKEPELVTEVHEEDGVD